MYHTRIIINFKLLATVLMCLICQCRSETLGESEKLKREQFCCQTNSVITPQDVKEWLSDIESEAWSKMDENLNEIADLELEANEIEQHCNPGCLACCSFIGIQGLKQASKIYSKENFELFKLSFDGNVDIVVPFTSGKLTGTVFGLEKWFGQPNLSMLGHFEEGQLVGPVWKLFEENGFLVMDNFEFTGKGLYIYPGFEIGLEGTFQLGEMVKARPVIIDGYLCRMNGSILDPIVGRVIRDDIYVRDISTTDKITSNPLLKDPLEDIYVEVQKSTIPSAGEGLFLKKDAKAGTVVGFFNGLHIELEDTLKNPELEMTPYKVWNDWDDKEALLTLPKEYESVSFYNATLGHKINHNTEANTDYGFVDHPRFGKIRSVFTTKDLKVGDELFCGYAPTVDGNTFLRLVFKDFLQYMDIEDKSPHKTEYLENMKNNYKKVVNGIMTFDLESRFDVPVKP